MDTIVTTLTGHEAKAINGRNGAFTLHKFKAADGRTYDTSKQEIADQAYGLLNQPAIVAYETAVNGQYTNYRLQSTTSAPAGAVATAAPSATAAPTGAPAPNQGAPAGGGRTIDEKDERITRHGCLNSALHAIEIGVLPKPSSRDQLFKMADIFVGYVQNGRQQAANQTAAQPQAGSAEPSPGAPGGDANGGQAATAAPVANQPVAAPAAAAPSGGFAAPVGPDSDIPFAPSII